MQRRTFLVNTTGSLIAAAGATMLTHRNLAAEEAAASGPLPVKLCLNTSTISGQKLSLPDQVKVCADAGYSGIEPWIRDLRSYASGGGSLQDLKKMIDDRGLKVESAIGFANWIVDDDAVRNAGLEEARRDMEMIREIGGTRIAAPPVGAQNAPGPALEVIATRYRALLEVGKQVGVTPQLELWGFSKTLSKLSELAFVAAGAEHSDACVLPDFYHIYKGGSEFSGLQMIEASKMHVFHIKRLSGTATARDDQRRGTGFPGDGICPLVETIAMLLKNGFKGAFSLELFNPEILEAGCISRR